VKGPWLADSRNPGIALRKPISTFQQQQLDYVGLTLDKHRVNVISLLENAVLSLVTMQREGFTIVAFNSSTAKCVWESAFSLPPREHLSQISQKRLGFLVQGLEPL
jgi:hypothetical protein